ncbi:LysR family transcriptional regulator [Microbacterium panaciterrae]
MMTPQQLRVLVGIREHGSLTAAAAALGYGVPTITHHLAALEGALGAQLVFRERRGARLTPVGESLADEAEQILVRLAQAERLVAAQRDAGLVTLRVGTFASIGSRLIPPAIRELRQQMNVQVEVIEAEPTEVVRLLRSGDVHAGLIYDFADDPAFLTSQDLSLTVLLDEPWGVLTGLHHVSGLEIGEPLDFNELCDADWICSRNQGEASDRVLRRACHTAGFEPRVLMRTDDLSMIHGLAAAGLGYALTTAAAVDSRFDVALHPAFQHLGIRRTSYVTHAGRNAPAVRALLDILMDLATVPTAG